MLDEDFKQWAGPKMPPDAKELADRYAIGQLARTYALGIDMRDLDLVTSNFADDAVAEGSVAGATAKEYLSKVYAGAAVYAATQHNITNQYITVKGDEAYMWSYAIAYHMEEKGNGLENLVVGVIYKDQCRRYPKGWLIQSRKAKLLWIDGPMPRKTT